MLHNYDFNEFFLSITKTTTFRLLLLLLWIECLIHCLSCSLLCCICCHLLYTFITHHSWSEFSLCFLDTKIAFMINTMYLNLKKNSKMAPLYFVQLLSCALKIENCCPLMGFFCIYQTTYDLSLSLCVL